MNTADYYYEIAYNAKKLADEYEPDAREALNDDNGTSSEDVIEGVEEAVNTKLHSVFDDELGQLWTVAAVGTEQAQAMAEIIVASNARFRPTVEGRPLTALREGTRVTLKQDIEKGAFDMLRKRLHDDGLLDRR